MYIVTGNTSLFFPTEHEILAGLRREAPSKKGKEKLITPIRALTRAFELTVFAVNHTIRRGVSHHSDSSNRIPNCKDGGPLLRGSSN